MKFLQYIMESRTKELDDTEAIGLIKSNCKSNYKKLFKSKNSIRLYRGVDGLTRDYYYIDSNSALRPNKNVYISLLMGNLPSWKGYPDRNRCVVCSTDAGYSSMYSENIYCVIPYDDALVGVCSERDLWESFIRVAYRGINSFNKIMDELFEYYKIKVDTSSWDSFKKSLLLLDKLYDGNDKCCRGHSLTLDEMFNKKNNILKNLDILFDPDRNDFKLGIDNMYEENEVWIQGKCVLVKESVSKNMIGKQI